MVKHKFILYIRPGPSRVTAAGGGGSQGPINPPPPHSVCLEIEGGNVGRGVPSPSDDGFGGAS